MKISSYFTLLFLPLFFLGCPDNPKPPAEGGEMAGEDNGGGEVDRGPQGGEISLDMMIDMDPMEASPCEADDECFAGRICVEGACADAECQLDSDCDPERPVCIGPEGEEEGERRGRCGDCRGDDECAGRSTCELFSDDGGLCVLEGNCEGSIECAPRSTLVFRGPQSEVCLDRRSSGRDPICAPAFNCQAEDRCPEGLTCLESGQCAALSISEECAENNQCGLGDVCRRDGRCGPCERDDECGEALSCAAGRCQEIPGACTSDDDCLGARRCVIGECAPPECDEDPLGEHTTFDDSIEIDGDRAYRGMVSCGDDWYHFTLAPATSALVAVRQRDRGANLGLVIMDDAQREIGRSVGSAPVEAVRLRESAAPRVVFIRVFQEDDTSAAEYDLEISYVSASSDACLDDPFELNGGDDEIGRARMIRFSSNDSFPSSVRGQVCAGDVDFFCFEMRRGELLSVLGTVDLGDALVVGQLIDPQGGEIGEGRWAADQNPINIEQEVEQNGLYCLSISSDVEGNRRAGQGRYTLEINGVSPELAGLCDAKTLLTLEGGRGGELGELSGENVLSASCAPDSDGPERAYSVNVTEPSLLIARVAGVPAGSLGDPVISLRAECDRDTTEIACSARSYDANNPYIIPPNPAVLRAPITPPVDPVTGEGVGQYTLIVDGVSVGDRPNYQIDVELRPLAPPPVNDDCSRVIDLSFEEGVVVAEVALDQAGGDLQTCGEGGPDATYSFTLTEPSDVLLQVTSKPAEFPVIVSLSDVCGGPALQCGYGVNERLEAGTYHITVAGADAMSRGLVELQVSATPLPAAGDNETCADAIELEGDEGSLLGDTRGAQDDYQLSENNLCTQDNSNGGDLAYRIAVTAGETVIFTAVPELGWDLSLYILSGCNGNVDQACLAGQDGALTERLIFTPQQSGEVYLIVDGANGEAGAFELSWSLAP